MEELKKYIIKILRSNDYDIIYEIGYNISEIYQLCKEKFNYITEEKFNSALYELDLEQKIYFDVHKKKVYLQH